MYGPKSLYKSIQYTCNPARRLRGRERAFADRAVGILMDHLEDAVGEEARISRPAQQSHLISVLVEPTRATSASSAVH